MKKNNLLFAIVLLISCEGDQGETGPMGSISLINIENEIAGNNCSSGGFKIETGVDINNNGVLDDNEIQSTEYICNGNNGSDGMKSLVNFTEELAGDNCSSGGYRIDLGIDINNNGVLDDNEIQSTEYICNGNNGSDGMRSLINFTEELAGDICSSGGYRIDLGIDINNNGVLDDNEIQSTEYICNGNSGSDGNVDRQTRIYFNGSVGTSSTNWEISPHGSFHLYEFNKLNYPDVDSITFVPSLYTSEPNVKCEVRIFNVTDNEEVLGTELESNSTGYDFIESGDIYNLLPDKKVTLAIQIRSAKEGTYVSTGAHSYLFIYRSK
ncbi:DUF7151 family protein [Saccharicrinis aurantiacus]|uniref:DUF7151 family protein n=1 Tax=Saccharicrinis aurantiacus TaxID=1849719 RepID=UPI000950351A|nr:hypothetical protein [Saccharicrinis aurantiacus]